MSLIDKIKEEIQRTQAITDKVSHEDRDEHLETFGEFFAYKNIVSVLSGKGYLETQLSIYMQLKKSLIVVTKSDMQSAKLIDGKIKAYKRAIELFNEENNNGQQDK